MGWLKRLLGSDERDSEALAFEVGIADLDNPDHVEVDVVGEASYQDALSAIAGGKSVEARQLRVGATLRCEPNNQYDPNAVRVEVMGQLVGYLPRAIATRACPGITRAGGAVEGQGLIVGGWKDRGDEGHFGIRVWLAKRDADRVGLRPLAPVPDLPPAGAGETRLSPEDESKVSSVTVTCEEHYQPAIEATMPADWNRDWWPCVATMALVEANPHTSSAAQCVEVRLGGLVAGYLTSAMTERHASTIAGATEGGRTASARAQVSKRAKGGSTIWRVQLVMPKPPAPTS